MSVPQAPQKQLSVKFWQESPVHAPPELPLLVPDPELEPDPEPLELPELAELPELLPEPAPELLVGQARDAGTGGDDSAGQGKVETNETHAAPPEPQGRGPFTQMVAKSLEK
jgi:hypothetical protein